MRNIIITGGELFNKGAQAMVFITVDEMKKRFPDHEIYVFSTEDLRRPKKEQDMYAFKFTGWYPIKYAQAEHNIIKSVMCMLRNKREYQECRKLYENCDLMVDISGYALGSNWSDATCNNYLDHIEFAKAFNIPMILMPQSFGPFDFRGDNAEVLFGRCKELLKYPKVICAREKQGYNDLKESFGLDNIRLVGDLVLNNKDVDLNNVFKDIIPFDIPEIEKDSVGIIPNGRNLDVLSKEEMLSIYKEVIDYLLEKDIKIYLLSHASSDELLCRKIKDMYESEKVCLLSQDFACYEFNEVVKNFRFVIASRFHSIVHAYKNGIPCIAIGWAIKYHDLLSEFGQHNYMFDVREGIDKAQLVEMTEYLIEHADEEKKTIESNLSKVQKENVFDIITGE